MRKPSRHAVGAICLVGFWLIAAVNLAGDPLRLSIRSDQGGLLLSWPASATNAVLEQSPALGPPAWSSLSPALYQRNADSLAYRLSALTGSRWFRLRRTGPPVAGLTGYWQLDEGAGSAAGDQTGLGTGLYLTNAAWAPGRFGAGSLQFNGQDLNAGGSLAWVSNANYQVLPPAGLPFSVSLWFSPDSLPVGSQRIVGNDANGSDGWDVSINTVAPGTNVLVLTGTANGALVRATGRTLLLPGQWHQLTVTWAGNQAMLYLDGSLLAQATGALANPQGALYFGAVPGLAGGFAGRIDEIRTYTNALNPEQICVTGQWHFDENAGDLAADSSIQGGLASLTATNAWTPGKSGSGIDLAAGSILIPNDDYRVLAASGGPFSLSLWLYPRALPVSRSGLLSCAEGANAGWQFTVETDPAGQAWLEMTSTNLGGTLALRAPVALASNAWSRLDLTYNGGMASVYLDGSRVGSDSGAIRGARAPLMVGAVPGTAGFNGVVDELVVYSRERAEAEIGPVALPIWEMALVNSSTNLVLQGAGPAGKPLTFALLSTPALGTITYSPGSPVVTYQAGGQKGPDSFVYTVSDGEFTSPPATAVVSVVTPHWLSTTGGVAQPLDGGSPDHAWTAGTAGALDAIWATNNYYDCFFYAPGEYQTTGARYLQRSTANPGCKHIGSGDQDSVIKLVDTWSALEEGVIFARTNYPSYCDGFEVRNLVLDCNAQGNPKYTLGEPVWLRIPLAGVGWVQQVMLHWNEAPVPIGRSGRAADFSVCARIPGAGFYLSNCVSLVSTGAVDVVGVATNTDELLIQLNRRIAGVDFYGLSEVEVSGAAPSLPVATRPDGGKSQLDAQHSILFIADRNPASAWASGPESLVQITLPLRAGTAVSQVRFQWNCQTLPDLHRLGPASQYVILARDPNTGQFQNVPFVTQGRSADGWETAAFGTNQAPTSIVTDQLLVVLTAREAGADYYSLREVELQNGPAPVPMRLPMALNSQGTNYTVLHAFDGNPQSAWVSDSQGEIGAIGLVGSDLKFIHLKVVGFGTKAGRECFPLILVAPALSQGNGVPVRNVLVEDCLFTQPATNNSDGVSAVVVEGQGSGALCNAIVRRCTVSGLYAQFRYSHGFVASLVENCLVDDCEVGVYFEPDPTGAGADSIGPVIIRSNLFLNVRDGINLNFHPGGHFDSLVCLGNEMVLRGPGPGGWGILACDVCNPGHSGTITNLTALGNIVRYADWVSHPGAPEGGLFYTDIRHAVYGNNLIVLGSGNLLRVRPYPAGFIPGTIVPEDCDHPGIPVPGPSSYPPSVDPLLPGYRRAWFNNRDLSGQLAPVGFWLRGVAGLASQQQWPQ